MTTISFGFVALVPRSQLLMSAELWPIADPRWLGSFIWLEPERMPEFDMCWGKKKADCL